MDRRIARHSALAFVVTLLLSAAAHAQLFRAYLAPSGSDANNCTLAAPCRLLPAALAAVADGGEIWMLDSANYNTGPVNIAKSVTILAVPGTLGSLVASGGNAINIATAGVRVVLRNLVIVPLPGAVTVNGIVMTAGAKLLVESCEISGFSTYPYSGIYINAGASVTIADSVVRGNSYGIRLDKGSVTSIVRSRFEQNAEIAIYASPTVDSTVVVHVSDTHLSDNNYGIYAEGPTATRIARVTAIRTVVSASTNWAFTAWGPGATTTLSGVGATGNLYGTVSGGGGITYSTGDNAIFGNWIDTGTTPASITLK